MNPSGSGRKVGDTWYRVGQYCRVSIVERAYNGDSSGCKRKRSRLETFPGIDSAYASYVPQQRLRLPPLPEPLFMGQQGLPAEARNRL